LLILKAAWIILSIKRVKNSINTDKPMSGKKVSAISKKIEMVKVKGVCKKMGCTINDFMSAVLSNTIFEYFDKKGENYESIGVGIPFSLR
jgi:NRPS condensation-like uncharacterized protein